MSLSSIFGSSSIFQNGKLKPGVYKIQNVRSETYLDLHLHSMELCCRPAKDLAANRGLWKIGGFGDGYAIWRVDPGNPHQFCSPLRGISFDNPIGVTPYPVGWRIQRADDKVYSRYEYIRIYFGPDTDQIWDLWDGNGDNGALVKFCNFNHNAQQVWRLIPAEAEDVGLPPKSWSETFGLGLPPYDMNEPGQSSSQRVEPEDDFGTVVTEVTIVTTRKRYRVDALPIQDDTPRIVGTYM